MVNAVGVWLAPDTLDIQVDVLDPRQANLALPQAMTVGD
jgi:hypothetical protein